VVLRMVPLHCLQPFFAHWDKLLGTYLDPEELRKGKKE
jgi:hypothetical protein